MTEIENNETLYQSIAALNNLREGWQKVADNDGMPGVDGVTVLDFCDSIEGRLHALRNQLLNEHYAPKPLLSFQRKKIGGGFRTLSIPTVADRIVQSSALLALNPLLDAEFSNVSYGYRKGISRLNAVQQIDALRDQGYCYVVDADIEQFFDTVDHEILLQRCSELISDTNVVGLIQRWIQSDSILDGVRTKREKGLPQGAAISPLMANLYLDRFDDMLTERGNKLVRFADDFLILCKTKPQATEALELSGQLLARLNLKLHSEKTRVTSFDEGFRYLGYLFVKSIVLPSKKPASPERDAMINVLRSAKELLKQPPPLPPTVSPPVQTSEQEQPVSGEAYSPFLRTLYIQEQGSMLKKESERFIIQKGEEELLDIQAIKIEQIFIFGACMITPASMRFCLTHHIPITMLSNTGEYYGRIESTSRDFTMLQRLQILRAFDDEFTLNTAKAFVRGKLSNTIAILKRYYKKAHRATVSECIESLQTILQASTQAESHQQLLGYEGSAAARYFETMNSLIADADFHFAKRSRQPPLDRMNSLLSFLYTLIFYNVFSLVRAQGLNPFIGVLHRERVNHPALVSDFVEEFRFLAETTAIYLVNNKIIRAKDFVQDDESRIPFLLSDPARKKVIHAFEETMQRVVLHPETGVSMSYRRCIETQVKLFAQVLMNEKPEYTPFMRKP